MNFILENTNGVKFYTDMRLMFKALGISAADYAWYISDIETKFSPAGFSSDDQWMSGEALLQLVSENQVQFIWAVFSAVPKGFRAEVLDGPYADGNRDYWHTDKVAPQLTGALFEIACVDSSCTIFIQLPQREAERLTSTFSDIKRLEDCRVKN